MIINAATRPALQSANLTASAQVKGGHTASHKFTQQNTASKFTQFISSIDNILSIYERLPKNDLTIEELLIKGNQVVVKYKTQNNLEEEAPATSMNAQAVSVNSMEVFSLDDGKRIERWEPVYQIKR
jgi:hypothetical protein